RCFLKSINHRTSTSTITFTIFVHLSRMNLQENVPLAPLTTLQVGGSARFFTRAASVEDVEEAAAFASDKELPLFVLGGGSNVLISDRGWQGLVLQVGIVGI